METIVDQAFGLLGVAILLASLFGVATEQYRD